MKPDGSDLRLHAWGLRSPYGMTLDSYNNKLYITNNGADDKGIRPITNDTDNVYSFDLGTSSNNISSTNSNSPIWYGWPDFYGNGEAVTDAKFGMSKKLAHPLQFLIENHPPVTKPFAQLGVGYGVTQAAYVNSSTAFVQKPSIFIGSFGIAAPINHDIRVNGKIISQQIEMVDPNTGNLTDFLSLKAPDPSFRPVALAFNDKENALYITSIGKVEIKTTTDLVGQLPMPVVWPYPFTGAIRRVTHTGGGEIATTTAAGISNNTTTIPSARQQTQQQQTNNQTITTGMSNNQTSMISNQTSIGSSNQTVMNNNQTAPSSSQTGTNKQSSMAMNNQATSIGTS